MGKFLGFESLENATLPTVSGWFTPPIALFGMLDYKHYKKLIIVKSSSIALFGV